MMPVRRPRRMERRTTETSIVYGNLSFAPIAENSKGVPVSTDVTDPVKN